MLFSAKLQFDCIESITTSRYFVIFIWKQLALQFWEKHLNKEPVQSDHNATIQLHFSTIQN